MTTTKRYSSEQIVRKLRDADAMLNAGKDIAAMLQVLEISGSTLDRWRNQYGGMKSLEEENRQLKEIVADQQLDIKMLKFLQEGNFPRVLCRAFPEARGRKQAAE